MSTFNADTVKKIAHLARLNMTEEDVARYTSQLQNILNFVAQMDKADTTNIDPMAHPYELSQRLREDMVTEPNQRDTCQKDAPQVEAGLYLVPQVIEGDA